MGMSLRRKTAACATAAVALLLVSAWAGCNAGSDPVDDGAGTSDPGGFGGFGGAGGTGGAALPCDIDCASIVTDACHTSVCNEGMFEGPIGTCIVVAETGLPCDDGEFCTTQDTCEDGICVGGPQNTCGIVADVCQEVLCDEASLICSTMTSDDGIDCDSGNLCVVGAQCLNGLCIGTTDDCFFAPVPNECHNAVCNPMNGLCEPVVGNEGTSCTDINDLCTVGKACSAGVCIGGTPKVCTQLDVGCQFGVCDGVTGQCVPQSLNDNDPCDDFNDCTVGELCTAGVCGGGGSISMCLPGDSCCPSGCDELSDGDCILNILLLGEDTEDVTVPISMNPDWQTYRDALTAAGETWTELDYPQQPFPTAAELTAYNTIILFDESFIGYSTAQCTLLIDWLLGSPGDRNLFVAGSDFLADWATAIPGNSEYELYALWGMTYIQSSAGTTITHVLGVPGDPLTDAFSVNGLVLEQGFNSSGDYSDQNLGPAVAAGVYDGGSGLGLGRSALTHYAGNGYKVVWFGVNFHNGLTDQPQRNMLMTNIVQYFKQ
jgi:hypothetical protein